MKKILSAIAISMTAIMSASAIAAPHDYRDNRHFDARDKSHWNDKNRDNRYNRAVNPSRDWRTGQTLPRQYNSPRYQVSNNTLKRLPKANRNQQWYQINGDYVLVNERNDKIVKIIN